MWESQRYPFIHLWTFLRLSSRAFFNNWEYWGMQRLDQPFLRPCPGESRSLWESLCPWCHTVSYWKEVDGMGGPVFQGLWLFLPVLQAGHDLAPLDKGRAADSQSGIWGGEQDTLDLHTSISSNHKSHHHYWWWWWCWECSKAVQLLALVFFVR